MTLIIFRDEIHKDELGSKPLFEVMTALKPDYWFSAHLHVKFSAVVHHEQPISKVTVNSSKTRIVLHPYT